MTILYASELRLGWENCPDKAIENNTIWEQYKEKRLEPHWKPPDEEAEQLCSALYGWERTTSYLRCVLYELQKEIDLLQQNRKHRDE